MSEIARIENPPHVPEVNVAALLQAIVQSGVTSDGAAAVKELVLLQEHQQDREARQQWIQAFSRARLKLKTVHADKAIPFKGGVGVRWYYAPLEDLQDACEPALEMENLTLSFDTRREGNLCIGICWLYHSSGHGEKREFAINAVNCEGGDLGAGKKAKRGALTAMLGLKTRHIEEDARELGDFISPEQAQNLRERVAAIRPDPAAFLKFAQAEDFETIRQGRYGECDAFLRKAERRNETPSSPPGATVPTGAPGSLDSDAAAGVQSVPLVPESPAPAITLAEAAEHYAAGDVAKLRDEIKAARVGGGRLHKLIIDVCMQCKVMYIEEASDDQIRNIAQLFYVKRKSSGK